MPLEDGERVVWEGRQSGVTGASTLWWLGAVVAALGAMGLLTLPMLVLAPMPPLETLLTIVQQLACAVPGVAMALTWAIPRRRVSLALTDRRLLAQSPLGTWSSVWLKRLSGAERYVAVYQTRYGPRHVVTDRLELTVGPTRVLWGPTREVGFVLQLLEHGVLLGTGWIDLSKLPDLRGRPAPAESRTDVYVCATTRTDGDLYGPLFIGPTRVVRITETLSGDSLGRLYTLLGDPTQDPSAALETVLAHPATGHYRELDRSLCKLLLDRGRLEISTRGSSRSDASVTVVDLSPRDADRLRAFLARRA